MKLEKKVVKYLVKIVDSKFTNIENQLNVIGKKPGYDYSVLR